MILPQNVKEHAPALATPHAETGLLPRPAMTHKKLAECLVFAAANHLAIQSSEITGKRRETNLVEARWAIWLVMRDGGLTFQQIADQFLMHNGTIQHGVRKSGENHGNREKSFRNLLESIRKTIQS